MGIEIPVWLFYLMMGVVLTPLLVIGTILMLIGGFFVGCFWPKKRKKGGFC